MPTLVLPRRRVITGLGAISAVAGLGSLAGCDRTRPGGSTPLRIGWQSPLATQGQIAAVLKRDALFEAQGFAPTFTAFNQGGPQTEAALAGQLDLIFVGDQPAINLLLRGADWRIVGRLFYTRVCVLVPSESPVQNLEGLRGKRIGLPFGTVADREVSLAIDPSSTAEKRPADVVNLDVPELAAVLQAASKAEFDQLDAVAIWEPTALLALAGGNVRLVQERRTLGLALASAEFAEKHRTQLRGAISAAWTNFRGDPPAAHQAYRELASSQTSDAILEQAAALDPNFNPANPVSLTLSDADVADIGRAARWRSGEEVPAERINGWISPPD